MKAQYVGDIGDFGKVLLLKHLAECGFKIGIDWMLTPNDGGADGKHRAYAEYSGKDCLCCCDARVFEAILPIARKDREKRRIADLEGLVRQFCKPVTFFSRSCSTGLLRVARDNEAFAVLGTRSADLVFFDPDNGIGTKPGLSEKHVYIPEMKRYWERRQSLLTYHHLSRAGTHAKQIEQLRILLAAQMRESIVYYYRLCRGTARAYFLVVRPEHVGRLFGRQAISSIAPLQEPKTRWKRGSTACTKAHYK